MQSENNKRIAKNTVLLYIRMLLTLAVSLFSSRVILDTLGVVDFGIYSVVGGLVAMFTFLNSTLSGSTARFLTFEIGSFNFDKLSKTFKSAITIHLGVSLLILILAETLGLWLLESKLIIPENRMFAARVVYQISILSCIAAILRIPYNALIIAHERMGIYAYVSIIEAVLKLIIVYLLVIGEFDKLILYSALMFIVILLISFIYVNYCSRNFKECQFSITQDKEILGPMLSYSSWDLFGNFSVIARGHGINIMLNLFFGPVINAASGIAMQVQNAIASFADNFLTAVKPQIVKYFASGNIKEMQKLMFNAAKYSFLLLFMISFPLIIENRFVLNLWLKNVPEFAIVFCKLSLVNNLVSIMFRPLSYGIHATGKVKRISLLNGTIYLMVLPISYFMLKSGYPPEIPYIINILLLLLGCTAYLTTIKSLIREFLITRFFSEVVFISLIVALVSSIIPIIIFQLMKEGLTRFILVSFSTFISVVTLIYFIVLNKELRYTFRVAIINKLRL